MRRFAFLAALASSLWAAPQPPALRLGNTVEPQRIALDMTLSPNQDDFTGNIQIDLRVNHPVNHFWLNATDLSVNKAQIEQNGKTLNLSIISGGEDFVGFEVPTGLGAGAALLKLAYAGKVNLRSSGGVFRSSRNKDAYLYTQFEPIDARRAFPCFDEPGFKIPWQLTLHVPQKDAAVSNTQIESETNERNGMKAVRFKQTKPLPSYLIAFGVGPFEFVDAGKAGSHQVPVRVVVPRGDRNRAAYAASVTAEILTRLENYFGIPYPYDKADQLAVPLSFGGAMENPGLVTYDATIVLSPPGEDTMERQRKYAEIAAHELAHQWFGDMVTMAWWNDVWLNESFATWMSARLIADWKPEWKTRAEDQQDRLAAIELDTKTSARRINQPAESKSDIGNAFDRITYQKGGSVLAMFENIAGRENFRRAVHNYLTEHLFGNARAEDFLEALGRASKPEFAAAFSTFLNQNGVPEISAELRCDGQRPPKLELRQKRLLPVGSPGDAARTWTVPFCVAYSFGSGRQQTCQLLTKQATEMNLPGKGCPAWYLGNAGEVGYYQVQYDQPSLERLLNHRSELTLAELVGLLGDLDALADAGAIPLSQTLALVPKLKDDSREQIVLAAIELASMRSDYIPSDLRANYSRFVEANFGARARQVGWEAKPGESASIEMLRAKLVPFVAAAANDQQLVRDAQRLSGEWLSDHSVVSPDVARSMLAIAARHGSAALFDKILTAAKTEPDPYFRPMLIQTLGQFRNRKLIERSFQLAFDGTFDPRMSLRLLTGPIGDPAVSKLPYDYVKTHYDDIVTKLPAGIGTDYAATLPGLAAGAGCSDAVREDAKSFFEPRMKTVQGGTRALANALESIHLCAAQKPAAETEIAKFLSQYGSGSAKAAGI